MWGPDGEVAGEVTDRRPRVAWLAAALVVGVIVAGVAWWHTDLDHVNHEVGAARRETASIRRHAGVLATRIATARRALGDETDAADEQTTDRDRLRAALAVALGDVAGARSAVTSSHAHLDAQQKALGALRSCFEGVSHALNQVSVGDTSGALHTLTGAGSACAAVPASEVGQ